MGYPALLHSCTIQQIFDADVLSIWAGAPTQQACLIHDSGKHSVQVSSCPYQGIGL